MDAQLVDLECDGAMLLLSGIAPPFSLLRSKASGVHERQERLVVET